MKTYYYSIAAYFILILISISSFRPSHAQNSIQPLFCSNFGHIQGVYLDVNNNMFFNVAYYDKGSLESRVLFWYDKDLKKRESYSLYTYAPDNILPITLNGNLIMGHKELFYRDDKSKKAIDLGKRLQGNYVADEYALSPKGKYIAYGGNGDYMGFLYEKKPGKWANLGQVIYGAIGSAPHFSFDFDEKYCAIVGDEKAIVVEIKSLNKLYTFDLGKRGSITNVLSNKNGHLVISKTGETYVFDLSNGQEIKRINHSYFLSSATTDFTGQLLVTCGINDRYKYAPDDFRVYDLQTGERLPIYLPDNLQVIYLCVTEDKILYTFDDEGRICKWDLTQPEKIAAKLANSHKVDLPISGEWCPIGEKIEEKNMLTITGIDEGRSIIVKAYNSPPVEMIEDVNRVVPK